MSAPGGQAMGEGWATDHTTSQRTPAMTKLSHSAARLILAKERQMTSLIDKEIAANSDDMVFSKADWVPLYYDLGQKVTSDCGKIFAYRALTLKGQKLWLVFGTGKSHGYHATCADPFVAIERAQLTWAHRRAVKQDWDRVEAMARDLIWGRARFDIRVEDLKASPLCTLGIEGFRSAIGLSRVTRISGRTAALLMKVEPQMGFVLHAAMERHAGRPAACTAYASEGFSPAL